MILKITNYLKVSCMILIANSCSAPQFEIPNADSYSKVFMQAASNGTMTKSFAIEDTWNMIPLGAGYGGVNKLTDKITINFEIDESLVQKYNLENNTNYTLPPQDSYSLDENEAEIVPGKSGSSVINLKVNPLKLSGTKTFLIPVKISNISSNIPITDGLETTYILVNGYYENNPYSPIEKTGWSIVSVSSDNNDSGVGGRAHFCIDGDLNTCWLSQYSRVNNVRPAHPHNVVIDMKASKVLHGIQLFGRKTTTSSSQTYLFPKTVHVEISMDGSNWTSLGVHTLGYKDANNPEDTMYFEQASSCRYVKITILGSQSATGDTTGVAEVIPF